VGGSFPLQDVKVVIAEDEGLTQLQLKKIIKILGGEILAIVSGGSDAVEAVTTQKPDLVLMDVQMDNHIDGIEASKQILEQMSVCIVLMTAYDQFEEKAREIGVAGYLIKPVCAETLQVELVRILSQFREQHGGERERLHDAHLPAAGYRFTA